jgi:hypothetical protein
VATYLQLVNRVLRRIREEEVTSVDETDYAVLVAEFVSDAYDDVQGVHDWEALKHRTIVDITAGTRRYRLDAREADGGDVRDSDTRVPTVDPLSKLQFIGSDFPEVWLYDDDSDDEPYLLRYVSPEAMRQLVGRDRDDQEPDPLWFTIYTTANPTDGIRLWLEVYPEPTQARVIELMFWTRDTRLEPESADNNRNILVPQRPVFLKALLNAYEERGEELGEPASKAEQRFERALDTAVFDDLDAASRADRYEWRRD